MALLGGGSERCTRATTRLTPAERKLWQRLRSDQLAGYRFRRQHFVGRFIVDFFCAEASLAIEIDGDSHAERVEYDAERTAWLEKQKGWRVLRFANDDVHRNIEAVVEAITVALKRPPP